MRLIERGIETALVLIVAVTCASLMDSGPPSPAPGGVDGGGEARARRYLEVEATGKALEIRDLTAEEIAELHEGGAGAVVNAWNRVPDPQYGMRSGELTQTRVRLWAGGLRRTGRGEAE